MCEGARLQNHSNWAQMCEGARLHSLVKNLIPMRFPMVLYQGMTSVVPIKLIKSTLGFSPGGFSREHP
jgi:hypothetical protein